MKYQIIKWDCECEPRSVTTSYIVGFAHSFDCVNYSIKRHPRTTHGASKTPLYRTWVEMKKRCGDKFQLRYPSYKGIKCCELWQTFEGFRDNQPAGLSHKKGVHLARTDDIGDYYPENCRYATTSENAYDVNIRKMIKLPDGRFAKDVAKELGISHIALLNRIRRGDTGARLWRPYRK